MASPTSGLPSLQPMEPPSADSFDTMESAVVSEVCRLHDFYAEWFRGTCANTDDEFHWRFMNRLAPSFCQIGTTAYYLNRDAMIESIRSAYKTKDENYKVGIRNCFVRHVILNEVFICTFENWQFIQTASGSLQAGGRLVTAAFLNHPAGLLWLHAHETRLPDQAVSAEAGVIWRALEGRQSCCVPPIRVVRDPAPADSAPPNPSGGRPVADSSHTSGSNSGRAPLNGPASTYAAGAPTQPAPSGSHQSAQASGAAYPDKSPSGSQSYPTAFPEHGRSAEAAPVNSGTSSYSGYRSASYSGAAHPPQSDADKSTAGYPAPASSYPAPSSYTGAPATVGAGGGGFLGYPTVGADGKPRTSELGMM